MVLDPAMVIASAPYDRPAHFWAMSKFFANPVLAFILTSAGAVPVDVKNHQNDKLYASTFKTLEKGEVVALFPEGAYVYDRRSACRGGEMWGGAGGESDIACVWRFHNIHHRNLTQLLMA